MQSWIIGTIALGGIPLTWLFLILSGGVNRETSGDDFGTALSMAIFWPITLAFAIFYYPLYIWPISIVEYVKQEEEKLREKKEKLQAQKDEEYFVPEGYKKFELSTNDYSTSPYRDAFSKRPVYVFVPDSAKSKDLSFASIEVWIASQVVARKN